MIARAREEAEYAERRANAATTLERRAQRTLKQVQEQHKLLDDRIPEVQRRAAAIIADRATAAGLLELKGNGSDRAKSELIVQPPRPG
ncbi:hypothetical protein QA802_09120 [Streptomyces sp. B21-105]|uniref:hypothetical protein n=1 Tax=Streptomyces sp. B21-105 TaxID=3039417 RepID=UPI002FEF0491